MSRYINADEFIELVKDMVEEEEYVEDIIKLVEMEIEKESEEEE